MDMLTSEHYESFMAQMLLPGFGEHSQRALQGASVVIVGMGAIGCPVAQYLVAAGVGKVALVDDDCIEQGNLQRQILFSSADIGEKKVLVAKRELEKRSKHSTLIACQQALTEQNAEHLLTGYDVVVDGTDRLRTRLLCHRAARCVGTPYVGAAVSLYEGRLYVFEHRAGQACLQCAYEQQVLEDQDLDQMDCEQDGVLGALAGILGSMAAMEALRLCGKFPHQPAGQSAKHHEAEKPAQMLVYDGLSAQTQRYQLPVNPRCFCAQNGQDSAKLVATTGHNKRTQEQSMQQDGGQRAKDNRTEQRFGTVAAISAQQLAEDSLVLDVRGVREARHAPLRVQRARVLELPLEELLESENSFFTIKSYNLVAVYCPLGTRANFAIEHLRQKGMHSLVRLKL